MTSEWEDLVKWAGVTSNASRVVEFASFARESGLCELLYRLGAPKFGGNLETVGLKGAYAAGWADLMTVLFKMSSEGKSNKVDIGDPDFGGIQAALSRGDLKPEDLVKK